MPRVDNIAVRLDLGPIGTATLETLATDLTSVTLY